MSDALNTAPVAEPLSPIVAILLVAVGGAAGALLRFGLVALIKPHAPHFPLGTLACNLFGCAVIGALAGWLARSGGPSESVRLLIFAGLLGGFTTFSSFALELVEMLRAGRFAAAVAYLLLSNVLGIALAIGTYALTASTAPGGPGPATAGTTAPPSPSRP